MKIDQLDEKKKPSLRFPNHSKEWNRKEFSALFSFKRTNSYSRDDLSYSEGSVKNIHYGDIHTRFNARFDILAEDVPFLNPEIKTDKIDDEDFCIIGDVVMADASEDFADVGKAIEIVNLADERVVAGLHTLLIRPKKKTFAVGFLAYSFSSWKQRLQIMTYSQGAKVLGIPRGWLSRIFLDFPEIDEQQKVAESLSAVDEKIGQLLRKKELLTKYKKGVMQQIFDQKIRFKDDNGNNFPDWKEKNLGALASLITKGTTPTSIGFSYIDEGINFIKAENISKNGFIEIETTPKISDECNRTLRRSALLENDILFSIAGTLGRVAIVSTKDLPANTNQALSIIRLNGGADIKFIYYSLTQTAISTWIRKVLSVGAQPNLNLEQIGGIKLGFPTLSEQKKIADYLTAIDKKIDLVNTQLEKTKTFKKGLLQQMFV